MIDHVTQLHDAQTKKKVDEEEALTTTTTKEKVASVQDEAYAKVMDDTIVAYIITRGGGLQSVCPHDLILEGPCIIRTWSTNEIFPLNKEL